MLQYLLNATAIWLISLLMFDLFLRRESYHGYNRFFLLFTFLLGVFLPMWQWQGTGNLTPALKEPIDQVVTVKKKMIIAATPAQNNMGWEKWLMASYLLGAFVALVVLVIEVVKLVRYYRSGTKTVENGMTIVETGREHTPFSLFNLLFVCDKDRYAAEEWEIVVAHERRHGQLKHFIDVLLMQVGKVVFWFHPLIYLYDRRLLMVHEYQADVASGKGVAEYGKFLVEQALLQNAPALTHSFNRSPIKKRIIMLTRTSSGLKHMAKLLVFPLFIVVFACCSKSVLTSAGLPVKKNGTAIYNGNTFEFAMPTPDTIIITNPATGDQMMKVVRMDSVPVRMNGNPIFAGDELNKPARLTSSDKNLRDYMLMQAKEELSRLDDGVYSMNVSNVVVDANGRIVYYDYSGVRKCKTYEDITGSPAPENHTVNAVTANGEAKTFKLNNAKLTINPNSTFPPDVIRKTVQDGITSKVIEIMSNAAYSPAQKSGNNVVSRMGSDMTFGNHFKVQNHVVMDFDPKADEYRPLTISLIHFFL